MTVNVTWKGSPNFWPGRDHRKVISIVSHITVGSIESTINWFGNPVSEVSAHFAIAKTGQIFQFVHGNDTAWANGIIARPDPALTWVVAGINPNRQTLSIEHEGIPGDVMPPAQYAASVTLHKYLMKGYAVPADRLHLIGHYQINSVTRAHCPGPSFPWERLLVDVQK